MELTLWALIAAAGALGMRVGFAVHAAGMARSKNSAGAVMRHLSDWCVAVLAFWAVGFAIHASDATVFGLQWRALFGVGAGYSTGSFLGTAMVLVATGIVPGVVAERARFWPALIATAMTAGLVVPLAMLWTSRGWLARMGYHDPGGAGWLHLVGAVCAAVAAVFVGPRTGKFNRDGSSTAIPGHSVPLAGVGVVLLSVGFFGFVTAGSAGDRVTQAGMNVLVAGAAGGLASAILCQIRFYKPDVHLAYAGILGGLVAISAGATAVGSLGAVIIGGVAGVIVPLAVLHFDLRLRLDDPSGNVAVHGVGAVWGLIATPLFAQAMTFPARARLLGVQLLGVVALAALAGIGSSIVWAVLKRTTKLRASEADEFDGLDLAEHDIGAYPDFQQTMIKSYHLREM